jgi:hypothetical protein
MNAATARALARQWVLQEGKALPGVIGAFFHGSINELPEGTLLPATSDVDVMLVYAESPPELKLGKFRYGGALLEVSPLSLADVATAETVLANYPIAPSLRAPSVIWDPTGQLTRVQAEVAREFARRSRVVVRCEQARNHVRQICAAVRERPAYHDQVSGWLFAAGVTTHILLIAGLKNPTVRKRYLAVRELLEEYNRVDFYPTLLELMGAAHMDATRAEEHLDTLAAAFDAAGAVLTTPYRFAADMRPDARSVAIDGGHELIRRGDQREALFWLTAVYSRCMHVLTVDGTPALMAEHAAGYHKLLADLGIHGPDDLERGAARTEAALPDIWAVGEEILARNPEIFD